MNLVVKVLLKCSIRFSISFRWFCTQISCPLLLGKLTALRRISGNCIGEEGVTELRGQLEDSGKPDVLGSMSDDEGEPSDDEEDDELSGVGNGDEQDDDGNDESASPNVSLEVTGTSLKAESPLLGDDEEIQNELQKVGGSFLSFLLCTRTRTVLFLLVFPFLLRFASPSSSSPPPLSPLPPLFLFLPFVVCSPPPSLVFSFLYTFFFMAYASVIEYMIRNQVAN